MDAFDTRHDAYNFFSLLLENLQVVPENLERQLTLRARKRLSDVVFDRLRVVPNRPGASFLNLAVHRGDEFLFALMKCWPPFIMRLQVNKKLGVAESPGVGAVIRPASLRYDCFHLWGGRKDIAGAGCKSLPFRETGAVGQGS